MTASWLSRGRINTRCIGAPPRCLDFGLSVTVVRHAAYPTASYLSVSPPSTSFPPLGPLPPPPCRSANASTISQVGLEATLSYFLGSPSALVEVAEYYATRTELIADGLNRMALPFTPGGRPICGVPEGTFYVWADFSFLLAMQTLVTTDAELARFFRDRYKFKSGATGVAVIPGSAFSVDPTAMMIRVNCARCEIAELEAAVVAISEAVHALLRDP